MKTREKDGSFTSLQDFCERVDTKAVSKRVIESLIMAGAFDSFEEGHRAQHLANLEQVMRVAQSAQADREKGQMNLFGAAEQELPVTEPVLDEVSEWEHSEVLKNEKEQLGFYLSGHPLEAYGDVLDNFTTATSQTLAENPNGTEVYVAGQISSFRLTKTKKSGESMAILVIEDLEGVIDVVVFPEAYKISQHAIEEGNFVWIRGTVSLNRQQTRSDEGRSKRMCARSKRRRFCLLARSKAGYRRLKSRFLKQISQIKKRWKRYRQSVANTVGTTTSS